MGITFDSKSHTYTNTSTKENYISVTTLIGNYKPPFDSAYWSLYKAVKDVLSDHDRFDQFKRSVGGWKKVVGAWTDNPMPEYQEAVQARQEHYLLMWKLKSEVACEVGTLEHNKRENESEKDDYYIHNNVKYETPAIYTQYDILGVQDFNSNRVYTELLVYNDLYKVAGQVDWVRKKGRSVWIKDYKTSKEITQKAFQNEKMLAPLNDLPNANYYIYNLQLSLYAWMLEQCGYRIEGLEIIHTVDDDQSYEVPYLRSHIETMLLHHANLQPAEW